MSCTCADLDEPCPSCRRRISRAEDTRDWSDNDERPSLFRYERNLWSDS